MSHIAYVGLGGNLARPEYHIETAMGELANLPGTRLGAYSSLYRTGPVEVPDAQDDYINAVALLHTDLAPQTLISAFKEIEVRHGPRGSLRNASRVLDLDLLLYDQLTLTTPELILPHPRAHRRVFVLAPLLEIAPDIDIPPHGPASALLAGLANEAGQPVAFLRTASPIPAKRRSAVATPA